MPTTRSVEFLEKLIAFPTVSRDPNMDLITWCAALLDAAGARTRIIRAPDAEKANIFASIGPDTEGGVLLSGHTDVVPVDGQDWSVPPFQLSRIEDRLYGRGAADMKGFVACALSAALRAARMDLKAPLHLAFSYDEEIGCVGVRPMLDMLADAGFSPDFCIVGEPTEMQTATGHKGKTGLKATTNGQAGHSASAPASVNAIHVACDVIGVLRQLQDDLASGPAQDPAFDVPFTTVHVGPFEGGTALNIVPDHAEFLFEIRNLPQDDPQALLAEIRHRCDTYLDRIRPRFAAAEITLEVFNSYPALSVPEDSAIVSFMRQINPGTVLCKVAFGTEGGLFSTRLGLPVVVCGPGSMAQGHRADEFITAGQMDACDRMLDTLLERLCEGL